MDIPANTAYLFNLLDEHGVTDRQIKQKMIIMLKYYNPENRPSNTKYQEYLKSEHWLEVRGYALEEYPECHFCGDVEGLLVHHMNYDCLGNEDIDTDVLVSCAMCHEAFHTFANLFVSRKYRERFLFPRAGPFLSDDGVFRYGKFRGKSLGYVRNNAKWYVDWVYEETRYVSDRHIINQYDASGFYEDYT